MSGSASTTEAPPVRVLGSAAETFDALRELFNWAKQISFSYAWMTSAHGQAEHWLALPLARVQRGVVGLHFAQTDPEVLRILLAEIPTRVRVTCETEGTFHPKVIVGVRDGRGRAIVGSSNFTSAGFGKNQEVNLEIAGPADAGPIAELLRVIDAHFEGPRAKPITDDLLERYKRAHRERPRAPVVDWTSSGGPRASTVTSAAELDLDWRGYFELLCRRHDQGRGVFSRLAGDHSYETELERAGEVFRTGKSFTKMAQAERQIICGQGESTGYFGTTRSSGLFHHYVLHPKTTESKTLSRALAKIPAEGRVDLQAIIEPSKRAIDIRGVHLGCWTRMLCAKRPDVFLCINGAVKLGLRDLFGRAPNTIEGYVALLETIHGYPWARSGEPDGEHEAAMWRGRVAMLDALLYEPTT